MEYFIVTGASKGMGKALTIDLLSQGYNVITISRSKVDIDNQYNGNLLNVTNSVNSNDLKMVAKELAESNNEFKIAGIVNNAGLLSNKPFLDVTLEDFNKVFQTNVFGALNVIQSFYTYLSPSAHVLNIGSVGGVQGSLKFSGLNIYSASKGALAILTECIAEELKESNISVNALALPAVQTEMLEEAFPGYEAPFKSYEMASYISNFLLTGGTFNSGKIIEVGKMAV